MGTGRGVMYALSFGPPTLKGRVGSALKIGAETGFMNASEFALSSTIQPIVLNGISKVIGSESNIPPWMIGTLLNALPTVIESPKSAVKTLLSVGLSQQLITRTMRAVFGVKSYVDGMIKRGKEVLEREQKENHQF